MKLSILGCYSATPRIVAQTTSQVLETRGHVFLIDCGEGTQVQLRKYKIKFNQIKHIFISHLHGDHYFGLIGLISTFNLLTRDTDLHIYGPKGLKEIASNVNSLAKRMASGLMELNVSVGSDRFFDTVHVKNIDAFKIKSICEDNSCNIYCLNENEISISFAIGFIMCTNLIL